MYYNSQLTCISKYLNEEVMYCQDAENASVWILGPKKVLAPSVLVINSIPIWDPKKKHARVPAKIPRPPNAYILYRRDKHNQVKAEHPGLHNNEICKH
jgi:HMG (high mobility group) box.